MTLNVWLSFFTYTIFTALSPGPNNILALNASVLKDKLQRRNFLLGIYSGFAFVIFLCGFFSTTLVQIIPDMINYLNYLGAIYILWLAYHIATSKPVEISKSNFTQTFWKGFLLQFVNVKIILWGITAVTSFVLPFYDSPMVIFCFTILLSVIGIIAMIIWSIAGSTFNKFLSKYWQIFNITMAFFLLLSVFSLFNN